MKHSAPAIILFLLFSALQGSAQSNTDLKAFNEERNRISRRGMYVLGGWAVGNMAYSGVMFYQTEGSPKYFHQMNVLWNTVNVALAGGSLLSKAKNDLDPSRTLRAQMNTEKMFLANAALDLAYMTAGAYLTERAKNDTKNYFRFRGWGHSLLLQGGFLLLFDSAMYGFHNSHGKRKLYPLQDKVSISTSGLGLRIGIQL